MNKTLNDLAPGQSARIRALLTEGAMRRRLLDIGLIDGTEVSCLGRSPGGDPSAYLIRGAVIAIRAADCAGVLIHDNSEGAVTRWGLQTAPSA